MKQSETKKAPVSWNKVEIYHNILSLTQKLQLHVAELMTVVGASQTQRELEIVFKRLVGKLCCLLDRKVIAGPHVINGEYLNT